MKAESKKLEKLEKGNTYTEKEAKKIWKSLEKRIKRDHEKVRREIIKETQDPDFQDWYFGLTIGFLLEEMEFDQMVNEIYADSLSVSGSKERGVKEPRDRSPLSSPLSPCR